MQIPFQLPSTPSPKGARKNYTCIFTEASVSGHSDFMQVFLHLLMCMFLKRERPEMDDVERKKRIWLYRKNTFYN